MQPFVHQREEKLKNWNSIIYVNHVNRLEKNSKLEKEKEVIRTMEEIKEMKSLLFRRDQPKSVVFVYLFVLKEHEVNKLLAR